MLFERCFQPRSDITLSERCFTASDFFRYDCALQRSFTRTGIMMAVIFSDKGENVFQSENKTIGKQSKFSLNIR